MCSRTFPSYVNRFLIEGRRHRSRRCRCYLSWKRVDRVIVCSIFGCAHESHSGWKLVGERYHDKIVWAVFGRVAIILVARSSCVCVCVFSTSIVPLRWGWWCLGTIRPRDKQCQIFVMRQIFCWARTCTMVTPTLAYAFSLAYPDQVSCQSCTQQWGCFVGRDGYHWIEFVHAVRDILHRVRWAAKLYIHLGWRKFPYPWLANWM